MVNDIILLKENSKICDVVHIGKYSYYYLENGNKLLGKQVLHERVLIKCHECDKYYEVKFYLGSNGLLKRKYICFSCDNRGERNGFWGKSHTDEFKKKLSYERKGKWGVGETNPNYGKNYWDIKSEEEKNIIKKKLSYACSGIKNGFYGKKHSKKVIQVIKDKNKKWRASLTEDQKIKIRDNISISQKKLFEKDPTSYIRDRKKAALASAKNSKRYGMNSIEKIVMDELQKRKLSFSYSVILGYKQFDFGNKKDRILLEVHGDYWHGHPSLYGMKCGDGKRRLNDIQNKNMQKDKEKRIFAKGHNFKLFVIWERDVRKGNFEVIDDIERTMKQC